jgi:hypothetical protein
MPERVTVQGKIGRSATTNPLDERIDPYQSIGWMSRSVGHENSEYGVEWMRFEADAPIPELVENGAPIELLEFTNPNHPDRR